MLVQAMMQVMGDGGVRDTHFVAFSHSMKHHY
jgi:hypothetical protein